MWKAIVKAVESLESKFDSYVELWITLYVEEEGMRIFLVLSEDITLDLWNAALDKWEILHRMFSKIKSKPKSAELVLEWPALIVRIYKGSHDDWTYLFLPEEDAPEPAVALNPVMLYFVLASEGRAEMSAISIGMALKATEEWDEGARVLEYARTKERIRNHQGLYTKVLNSLGLCYIYLKLYDIAIERLEEALQIKKDDLIYFNLSYAYMDRGESSSNRRDYIKSEEYLRQAIAIKPTFYEAWYNLCCTLAALGMRKEAEHELANAPIDRNLLLKALEKDKDWTHPPSLVDMDTTSISLPKSYDIAISFAGENRKVAEKLADLLVQHGVRVFYDAYEQAELWGKDVYQHFADIYKNKAHYCLIIISCDYAKKLWTKHELRQAQARAFKESREYILPIRLDDTEIPGIPDTIGYLDLRRISEEQIVKIILDKLRYIKNKT